MSRPIALLAELTRRGATARVDDEGRIHLSPAEAVDNAFVEEVRSHKAELVVELQRREVMIGAQRLLRLGQWPAVAKVCDFHIGQSGTTCRRCGASWIEHYPAPADGAAP